MSLQKSTSYKGLELPNAIYKITLVSFSEKGKDELGKIYSLYLSVNSYTDETKEFDIEQKSYNFDTHIEGLTIENGYILLKGLEEFGNAIDL